MRLRLAAGFALALLGCSDEPARLHGTTLCTDCAPGAVRRTITSTAPFTQIASTGDDGVAVIMEDSIDSRPVSIVDADLANERTLDTIGYRLAAHGDDLYVMGAGLRAFDAAGNERWRQTVLYPFGALSAGPDGAVVSADHNAEIERFARETGAPSTIAFDEPQAAADPAGGLFATSAHGSSESIATIARIEGDTPVWTQTLAPRGAVELGLPRPLPDHRVAVMGLFYGPELRVGDLTVENPSELDARVPFIVELAADGTPMSLTALSPSFPHNAALTAVGAQLLLFEPNDAGILVSRFDATSISPLLQLGGARSIYTIARSPAGLWLVVGNSAGWVEVGGVTFTSENGETIAIELAL